MLMFAFVELTAGVLRNGIMQWYTIFAHDVKQPGAEVILGKLGTAACVFGIIGGFAGGLISDKFFQSRRGPPAVIFCAFMLMMAAVMAMNLFSLPFVVGVAALLIVAAVTGVHSLMSGTAAADFGGRKATATCVRDRGWIRLSRQRRAIGRRRLSRHASQLAMVADFPHAVRAHRRVDRLAHLARTSRRDACLYRDRGTKRVCGRIRKRGWRAHGEHSQQILA